VAFVFGRIEAGKLALAVLLAACLGTLLAVPAAAGATSCDGKKATISANTPRIVGTKAHDVIAARSGDNVIYGMGGNDTICGGGGDDRIYGDRGNDTILGESGEDTIVGERGSDDLDGGAGADRILGETGNDEIDGEGGDGDEVDGGPGDDSVDGGPGDFDIVVGGVGNDQVDGGSGAHDIGSYAGVGGPVSIDPGSGAVSGAEQEQVDGIEDLLGGSGDDSLTGSTSPNRLDGGAGDDNLVGYGDGDAAFGGIGSDACLDFAAENSCGETDESEGTAVAMISSITGATSLVVSGGEGPDQVAVHFTKDGLLLQGGGSIEVVLGDPGSNACLRDTAANSVLCRGGADSIQVSLNGGDDILAVADSVPSDMPMTINGGEGADTLRAGGANDTIYSGDDHDPDVLEGGGGDDVLYGVNLFHPRKDSGAAHMSGGVGDDLLIGGQPCDGDRFDGGGGDNDSASFARVRNSGTNVKATIGGAVLDPDLGGCNAGRVENSVEKIEGSPGDDVLAGDSSADTLLGRGGNDDLDGRGDFDRCIEGGGSDRMTSCEVDSWRIPLRRRIR
jgi:Ca2+-binding RTX toxin-like protein